MMSDYDIKFVNKEITPFGGLSLFLKMLEKCHFEESLFRHALINSDKKKFLKTIRYELISTPAYLGKAKDRHILYLARSMKTRQSFLSIWEKLKDFSLPYSTEKS